MGGLIPLSDASRRPVHMPAVTVLIILVNVFVFVLELMHGEAFVVRWSVVPADIVSGHHWVTIFTAMFMHGGWSHIIGNMVFLWAFGPEIEDAMGPWRYLTFYLVGGVVAMLAWGERSDCGGDGRVSGYLSSRPDSFDSNHLCVYQGHACPGHSVNRFLVPHPTLQRRCRGTGADRRCGIFGAHRRFYLRSCDSAFLRRPAATRFTTELRFVGAKAERRNQFLRPASCAVARRGRSVSCSAGEKALPRIKRLPISAVSPDDEKIMEIATNW